jgi:RNA polymerase sigma factor (TIGR02999 family)
MPSANSNPEERINAEDLNVVCASGAAGIDPDRIRQLVETLYPELRRIAAYHMRSERRDHTLQPTALVSECFLKMVSSDDMRWKSKSHFLMAASKAMRLLLIDHARSHGAAMHGGHLVRIPLDDANPSSMEQDIEYLDLHDRLTKLQGLDPRMASVVEMRTFGGLSFSEIGEVLGCHERTAKRDWQMARAWLFGELRGGEQLDGGGMGTH